MSEFEKDLANVMGNFIQTELDCVEKQNQEIEQLQQENRQLKEKINKVFQLKKILNNETLDKLPFDIAEQMQDLFEEILKGEE